MHKIFLLLLSLLSVTLSAYAENSSQPDYAFFLDNICIFTGADIERMNANLKIMNAVELPFAMAKNIPAEKAWMVKYNSTEFIVSYNLRTQDGNKLHDCGLNFKTGSHELASQAIESKYKLKKILDEPQGAMNFTGYYGDLIGFPNAMITVQSILDEPNYHSVVVTRGGKL